MNTFTQLFVACLIALGLSFAALSSAQACGSYDPVGMLQMQVEWDTQEVERAAVVLEAAASGDDPVEMKAATVRFVKARKALKKTQARLDQMTQQQNATASK